MDELDFLRIIDFEWTRHTRSVWDDSPYDVPELNADLRQWITNDVEKLKTADLPHSPLGKVIIGEPGAGKTHFVGALRHIAQTRDIGFIFIDMTDVNRFRETVLLGFITSLQQPWINDKPQYYRIFNRIENIIKKILKNRPVKQKKISSAGKIIEILHPKYPLEMNKYKDVLLALYCLDSKHPVRSNIGYSWLMGQEISQDDQDRVKFSSRKKDPIDIVEGLSWLMSLAGPTILALDQLDAIVAQLNLASSIPDTDNAGDEHNASLAIIEEIANGLMSLRDKTLRTSIIVNCLEATWKTLVEKALQSCTDRYLPAKTLNRILDPGIVKRLIDARIAAAAKHAGFEPPSPQWLIEDAAYISAIRISPREILKRCDQHRERCLREKKIIPLASFDVRIPEFPKYENTESFAQLDALFESFKAKAKPELIMVKKNEDEGLRLILISALRLLIMETRLPDNVDSQVDSGFGGGKKYPPLHARLRLIYRDENDREEHFCVRGLLQHQAYAFQVRLKAAMIASGIDRKFDFRRLVIIRNEDIPTGPKTIEITKLFESSGGVFYSPAETELRIVWALQSMEAHKHPEFKNWLRDRKPLTRLEISGVLCPQIVGKRLPEPPDVKIDIPDIPVTPTESTPPADHDSSTTTPPETNPDIIPLGYRMINHRFQEPFSLPLMNLIKHSVILAGSGSGKTVLLRRIIEESALLGIPALVIDSANDLARLGDPWPEPPEQWEAADVAKSQKYVDAVEVIVWTPGREKGNPLTLAPIPDFKSVVDDKDELEQAVAMTRETLKEIAAPTESEKNKKKRGILTTALKFFAYQGGGELHDFVELLADLPEEAGGGIQKSDKLAAEMADQLKAAIQINLLLKQTGKKLDPSIFFKKMKGGSKTRISVLNFVGLPDIHIQQQFMNQLAMLLFTWVKRHPAPKERPLRGLMVIDEAKDFIPSKHSTPCKHSLIRLAAQARKYGLGLIFASQAPKDIDHTVIANCSTQFFGQANSPSAISVIQDQLRQRGANGEDIAVIGSGKFYAYSEGLSRPVKIAPPLCLSHHPATPLMEEAILARAESCRSKI